MRSLPRISFGIIVLNGEPFTKYCLRSLYPFAYEIIVAEGGSKSAIAYAPEGHSTDGTREALHQFKEKEDRENKVKIITRDSFWDGKDEQSQAYAAVATGDYLWQVDIDEFYTEENLTKIIKLIKNDTEITAISFKTITFWGDLETVADGWALKRGRDIFHRLFKWGKGYKYVTHYPPTVCDENGINLRSRKYLDGNFLYKRYGIFMSHYAFLFPSQVVEKGTYYANYTERVDSLKWAQDNYLGLKDPFRVHTVYEYPSWLERFTGNHCRQVIEMFSHIRQNNPDLLRNMDDVDLLLSRPTYQIKKFAIEYMDYIYRFRYKLSTLLPILFRAIVKSETLRTQIRRILHKFIIKPSSNKRANEIFLRQ